MNYKKYYIWDPYTMKKPDNVRRNAINYVIRRVCDHINRFINILDNSIKNLFSTALNGTKSIT